MVVTSDHLPANRRQNVTDRRDQLCRCQEVSLKPSLGTVQPLLTEIWVCSPQIQAHTRAVRVLITQNTTPQRTPDLSPSTRTAFTDTFVPGHSVQSALAGYTVS